jgi:hypothetical protein
MMQALLVKRHGVPCLQFCMEGGGKISPEPASPLRLCRNDCPAFPFPRGIANVRKVYIHQEQVHVSLGRLINGKNRLGARHARHCLG